jgi:hypothetical protein
MAEEAEVETHSASYQCDARSPRITTAVLASPGYNAPILSHPIASSSRSQYAKALDLDADASKTGKSITTPIYNTSKRMRSPSSRETLRDLGMPNKPIVYTSSCSTLSLVISPHWQVLGGICRVESPVSNGQGMEALKSEMESLEYGWFAKY